MQRVNLNFGKLTNAGLDCLQSVFLSISILARLEEIMISMKRDWEEQVVANTRGRKPNTSRRYHNYHNYHNYYNYHIRFP